jgi:hypothetical protein
MKTWHFVVIVVVLVALLLGIMYFVPIARPLIYAFGRFIVWCGRLLAMLLVLAFVFGFASGTAWLLKSFGIAYLDKVVLPDLVIHDWMHFVFSIVCGALIAVAQVALMPIALGFNTWVREFLLSVRWSGVFESMWSILPTFLYALVVFMWTYMSTGYKIDADERYTR